MFRYVMADEYLPPIVFTVEETAARWEAEQLRVSQPRSTKVVEEAAASREADRLRTSRARAEETAGEGLQSPDEKISVRRVLQGTVRDLILLTMWVIPPTIVVIFV